MFNFIFMENTNEEQKMVTPDSKVENFVEVGEKSIGNEQEPVEIIEEPTGDDPTMNVLKQFPQVCSRIAEIMKEHAENVAMNLLQKGMDFDEAVANANIEGYRRGKNEKIELVKQHRLHQSDNDEETSCKSSKDLFPAYGKKSFWDKD